MDYQVSFRCPWEGTEDELREQVEAQLGDLSPDNVQIEQHESVKEAETA